MKHISVRYISEVDLNEKLDRIHDQYRSGRYCSILFHIYSGVLDRDLLISISKKLCSLFETDQVIGSISAGEIKNGR